MISKTNETDRYEPKVLCYNGMKQAKCVVIGGGTGSFSVLSGLKHGFSDISAIVSMTDDGGSTGMLRDELEVLPPGDVRQCLVALSEAPEEMRELFNFRFQRGSLEGHAFGNLFLSAVEQMTDNFGDAVRIAGDVLRIKGQVVPITLDNVRLAMSWGDGTVLRRQGDIDVTHFIKDKGRPDKLFVEPQATINPSADKAIREADIIVIAPGDIYTSLGPLLVVDGVAEALAAASATIVYVCNLVIKPGHTSGFTVADHAAEIERFAGGPVLDYVLYNTAQPSEDVLAGYSQAGELLVEADARQLEAAHYKAIGLPLIAHQLPQQSRGDPIAARRSFIRHDAGATTKAITDLLGV